MTSAAIIVAAGRGTRAGGDLPKQWQLLAGEPVLTHTIEALRPFVDMVVLAIHPDDREKAAHYALPMVDGGSTRMQSVRNALEWLSDKGIENVLIHDGARPTVPGHIVRSVLKALETSPGAAPALAVTDALWRGTSVVEGTADRTGLWRAQTPQGFHFDAILKAHRSALQDAADDVELARAAGYTVAIVPGDEDNLKVTFPGDFLRAEAILKGRRMDIRVGNGFDVHAFTEGQGVWLCGVRVPHTKALLGHSDADVGMHALTDAIYGALAEGDIGVHFPPSDPQWKGAESQIFLRHAMQRVQERGFSLSNCDVTLICERPKVGPHQGEMRAALAEIMGVEIERISVKATTSEKLGFTGREEGIAALATATLVKK